MYVCKLPLGRSYMYVSRYRLLVGSNAWFLITSLGRLLCMIWHCLLVGERKFIRHMACQFILSGEVLYKRNHDTTLLWCIDSPKANHLMEEMHEGLLRAYASGPLLARKIMKPATIGFPWKAITSSMSGRATVAKSIIIGRMFLPNLCTL